MLKNIPLAKTFQSVTAIPLVWMIAALCQTAQKAWILACEGYGHDRVMRRFTQRLRWVCAAMVTPRISLQWFDELNGPALQSVAEKYPRMAFKPLRVYMSTRWNKARRMKVIRETQQLLLTRKPFIQDALLKHGGSLLASLDLHGYGSAKILIGYDHRLRKEGEVMISFWSDELSKNIVSLSFSLERQANGALSFLVGCIQGGCESGPEEIKAVTKAMNGLRPKALMVHVAQELARALEANSLFGVGNSIHPHRRKHLIYLPFMHEITFDYDQLWQEMGGEVGPDGWYVIPLVYQQRPLVAIKANKRSQYARRYRMLDMLSEQIQTRLA